MSGGKPKQEWTYAKCPCGHQACNQYTINRQGSVGFSLADARLIAAAPDLLDALKRLLEFVEAHTATGEVIPSHTVEHVRSRAAILKAEGGAS
jgi:hypothetical protein